MTATASLRPTASHCVPDAGPLSASLRPTPFRGTQDADAVEGRTKEVSASGVQSPAELADRKREATERLGRAHRNNPLLQKLTGGAR